MKQTLCGLVVACTLVGCGNPAAKFQEGAVETPTWEALEKLRSEEVLMPVGMAAMNEDWKGLKEQVTRSEFKAAVDGFAKAEIPSKFATDERKAAKEQAVADLRKLIEAAESGASDADLKSAYETVDKSLADVSKAASQ